MITAVTSWSNRVFFLFLPFPNASSAYHAKDSFLHNISCWTESGENKPFSGRMLSKGEKTSAVVTYRKMRQKILSVAFGEGRDFQRPGPMIHHGVHGNPSASAPAPNSSASAARRPPAPRVNPSAPDWGENPSLGSLQRSHIMYWEIKIHNPHI